jgi:hypothetical protein
MIMEDDRPGQLIIVGSGITGIAQLTLEAVAWVEAADVVCYVLADPLTERWLHEHARETEDLARLHRPDEPRLRAYRAMSERLVEHARAGRLVVGVFYGHPGVFTSPSHWAIRAARSAGLRARMLAAVSAEDCLFADLGVDPGEGAGQSFEATDLLVRARVPATDAHVVIWQIGVVAQLGLRAEGGHVASLVAYLLRFYPGDHLVTHYQAAQSVVTDPVIQTVPLADLGSLPLAVTSTLYVPPRQERRPDVTIARELGLDGPPTDAAAEIAGGPASEPGPAPAPAAEPDWYRPIAAGPSRLATLVAALSTDPSLLAEVRREPAAYLAAFGLDVIERWAFLARDQAWISACVREGSGPAAAVAVGAAATEAEARTFFVHRDGRLVRRRAPVEAERP